MFFEQFYPGLVLDNDGPRLLVVLGVVEEAVVFRAVFHLVEFSINMIINMMLRIGCSLKVYMKASDQFSKV